MSEQRRFRGETLWERWRANADARPDAEAIVHTAFEEPPRRWRWAELLDAALGFGAALHARGVRPGEVCALIIRHHADFYPLYLGVVAAGALPAVLAYPNDRIHPDKFREGLAGMLARSGLHWVLTEEALLPTLEPFTRAAKQGASSLKGVLTPLAQGFLRPSPAFTPFAASPDAPCLLQHSSGTTGLQKAVTLSHRAVLDHVERYGRAIHLRPDDKVVSWLPLYHDMGLIAAFQLPLAAGIPAVYLSPFEWVVSPVLLLEALANERGTLSWLPNFAYNLMASRVHDDDLEGLDLSCVRMLINCSEPIQAQSHERFAARFAARGIGLDKLAGCYAMAETTFAVTQTAPGEAALVRRFDREALSRGVATLTLDPDADDGRARTCVSSGKPVDGCEIRVVGEAGYDRQDGHAGEILVRSPSLFDGYRNDPERTEASFTEGWYHTGDIGFLHAGELFVVGRRKDIIIVAGRNIAPEDIEAVVSEVAGILPGRVVAFGVEDPRTGTEEVWVAAETEVDDPTQLTRMRADAVRAAMAIDVSLARCVLVPPRWLVKSSSGKLSRALNKQRALTREGATP